MNGTAMKRGKILSYLTGPEGWTFIMLVFAFALTRLPAWVWNQHSVFLGDTRAYLDAAFAVKQGTPLAQYLGETNVLISPLYIRLLYWMDHVGMSFRHLSFLQSILILVSGLVLYGVARPLVGKSMAALVTVFYWLSPTTHFYENAVMTEIPFSFFFFLTLTLFLRLRVDRSAENATVWGLFLASLVVLNWIKPLGRIFTAIYVLLFMLFCGPEIARGLRRPLVAALVLLVGMGLAFRVLRPQPTTQPRGIGGTAALVASSLSPLLDVTFPPVQNDAVLLKAVTPGIQYAQNQCVRFLGHLLPPKDGGFDYVNINFTHGVVTEVARLPDRVPRPGAFYRQWLWYSLSHNPVGFGLFVARQVYTAIVMLSGSFIDHVPDMLVGDLVSNRRPLLSLPTEELLKQRAPEERELSPAYKRFYTGLFDAMRFKRLIMFLIRFLFAVLSVSFLFRFLKALGQGRFYDFLEEEQYSTVIVLLFYIYAVFLAIFAVPIGRYFLMFYPWALVFVVKEIQTLRASRFMARR